MVLKCACMFKKGLRNVWLRYVKPHWRVFLLFFSSSSLRRVVSLDAHESHVLGNCVLPVHPHGCACWYVSKWEILGSYEPFVKLALQVWKLNELESSFWFFFLEQTPSSKHAHKKSKKTLSETFSERGNIFWKFVLPFQVWNSIVCKYLNIRIFPGKREGFLCGTVTIFNITALPLTGKTSLRYFILRSTYCLET